MVAGLVDPGLVIPALLSPGVLSPAPEPQPETKAMITAMGTSPRSKELDLGIVGLLSWPHR